MTLCYGSPSKRIHSPRKKWTLSGPTYFLTNKLFQKQGEKSLLLTVSSWGRELGFFMLISMLLLSCFGSTGDPCTLATPSNIWDWVNEGASAVGHSLSFSSSSPWVVSPFMVTFPSTCKNQDEQEHAIPQWTIITKSHVQTHLKSLAFNNHSLTKNKFSICFCQSRKQGSLKCHLWGLL